MVRQARHKVVRQAHHKTKLTLRQTNILEEIIKEYIDSAKPVSSQFLERECGLGICPATIRIEMQKLTDVGYVFQPHTSAGRVPTDKGYRFFVDNLLKREGLNLNNLLKIEKTIKEETKDIFKWFSGFAKILSEISSTFVFGHLLEEDFFAKEGWEALLKEPEFEDRNFLFSFTDFLEDFEKDIESLELNSEIKVYIGKENSSKRGEGFSVILSECSFPNRQKGIISILGPKRMPYEENISLMNSLAQLLEEI